MTRIMYVYDNKECINKQWNISKSSEPKKSTYYCPSIQILPFSNMSAIKVAKAALRTEIEKKIAQLSPEENRRQSQIVVERVIFSWKDRIYIISPSTLLQLFSLPKFKEAKNISVFLSMDSEINTEPIVRKIFEEGKQCFVPRWDLFVYCLYFDISLLLWFKIDLLFHHQS